MSVVIPYGSLPTLAGPVPPRRSLMHWLVLGLVWLTVASGAVVFTEPAPVDVLTMGLIIALPLVGLVKVTRGLVVFVALWMIAAAAAFVASTASEDLARSTVHSAISVYLYAACFVFAGFIARNPLVHSRLVFHAYLWAAFLGAVAGIVGYFDVVPGAQELFTKFDRASGTFKDPNVYGPFLVPAVVYAIHLVVTRSVWRGVLPLVMAAFLSFAILLSFSRGAWVTLGIAMIVYGYLAFVLAPTNWQRLKLLSLAMIGLIGGTGVVALAIDNQQIGRLLVDRAALTQTYDEGPEGRFGGQAKAQRLVLENPLGLGALQFGSVHHHEDVHNVYLSMFLNAGWIGGMIYTVMIILTTLYGFNHALKRTATQPIFIVAYAAFIGHAVEGFVIDTDHWRHFYLLLALIWGLMVSDNKPVSATIEPRRPARLPPTLVIRPRRPRRLIGLAPHRIALNGPIRRRGLPRRPPRALVRISR